MDSIGSYEYLFRSLIIDQNRVDKIRQRLLDQGVSYEEIISRESFIRKKVEAETIKYQENFRYLTSE